MRNHCHLLLEVKKAPFQRLCKSFNSATPVILIMVLQGGTPFSRGEKDEKKKIP
jgi:hypothetical protein